MHPDKTSQLQGGVTTKLYMHTLLGCQDSRVGGHGATTAVLKLDVEVLAGFNEMTSLCASTPVFLSTKVRFC